MMFSFSGLALIFLFQNATVLIPNSTNEVLLKPESFANLNPNVTSWATANLASGYRMSFWGHPVGCRTTDVNGPLSTNSSDVITDKTATGLLLNNSDILLHKYWTPIQMSHCALPAGYVNKGDSYFLINKHPTTGGIGIYTHNGPTLDGKKSFFSGYTPSGQGTTGVNQGIEGTFFSIRGNPRREVTTVLPFKSDQDSLRVRFRQTVDQVKVVSDGMQAKQQLGMTLINLKCFEQGLGACQVSYLINTAIYRSSPSYWDKGEFKNHVWRDAGQKGLVIVEGTLKNRGAVSVEEVTGSNVALWTSMGARTQHAPFNDRYFEMMISFKQFTDTLVLSAQQQSGKTLATGLKMADYYGASWNNPNEWALLDTKFAHEVYNIKNEAHYIGGSLTHLQIGSATLPLQWQSSGAKSAPSSEVLLASDNQLKKTHAFVSGLNTSEVEMSGRENIVISKDNGYVEIDLNVGATGQATVLMAFGPNRGVTDIYVDDRYHSSVNLFDISYNLKSHTISALAGTRKIKFVRSGETQGQNAFVVLNSVFAVDSEHTNSILFSDPRAEKEGVSWLESSQSLVLNKGASVAVPLSVQNDRIQLVAMAGPNRGFADIFINDVYFQTVDLYAAKYGFVTKSFPFNNGNYRIKIKRTDAKSATATDSHVVVYQLLGK